MGMGGGGGSSSQQTVRQEPWEPSQPFLRTALRDAEQSYFGGDFRPEVYQGDRVAGFHNAQRHGLKRISDAAGGRLPGIASHATGRAIERTNNAVQQIGAGAVEGGRTLRDAYGQYSPARDMSAATLSNPDRLDMRALTAQGTIAGMDAYGHAGSMADQRLGQAFGNIGDMARDEMRRDVRALDQGGDLDAVRDRVLDDTVSNISSVLGRSNAVDSSLGQDFAARGVASALAPIEYDAHERERDRQMGMLMQSQGNAMGVYGQEMAGAMGAVDRGIGRQIDSGQFDLNRQLAVDQGNQQARMQARQFNTGMRFNREQSTLDRALAQQGEAAAVQGRALSLSPGISQATYVPGQQLFAAGQARQGQHQAELNARQSRFQEGANADARELQDYTNMLLGYGGLGGTSTGPGPQRASTGSRIMGGLTTGAGIYGGLAASGVGAPVAGGIAGLAALGGLFS